MHLKPGDNAIEVIEVGAGGLLRLGGEGLVFLPYARRRRRGVSESEPVGSGRASLFFDFCGWNVGILDLE